MSEPTSHFTASGGPVSWDGLSRVSGWNGAACVVVGIWERASRFLLAPPHWTSAGPMPTFSKRLFCPCCPTSSAGQRARKPSHLLVWLGLRKDPGSHTGSTEQDLFLFVFLDKRFWFFSLKLDCYYSIFTTFTLIKV